LRSDIYIDSIVSFYSDSPDRSDEILSRQEQNILKAVPDDLLNNNIHATQNPFTGFSNPFSCILHLLSCVGAKQPTIDTVVNGAVLSQRFRVREF
jgi:hypothetical protein